MGKQADLRLQQSEKLYLRYVSLSDCNDEYLAWLDDHYVSQFLETRWCRQSISTIKHFVKTCWEDPSSHLFAIIDNALTPGKHIGNVKLGPVNPHHLTADLSYFIGNKLYWGQGYATEAVSVALEFGFEVLQLYGIKAGLYATNISSQKVLEKNGFALTGKFPGALRDVSENRVDHLWFYKRGNL